MTMRKILVALSLPLILFGFTTTDYNPAPDKVRTVFESIRNINSLKYDFIKSERINGEMIENKSLVKMHKRPYRIYIKEIVPQSGIEVLYPHPLDESKALVNPNGFPWVNLKLDPKGELMRKDQHHTILQGGFDHILSVMEYVFYKHKNNLNKILTYQGSDLINGQKSDIIYMSNPKFGYINHKVKKGESVSSIALKNQLSEYLIYEKNDHLGMFRDVKEDEIIKIPTDYAAKMILCIDQARQIPLRLEVFDDKGLFEKYEFQNVEINPDLSADEFEETFAAYSF